MQFRLLPFPGKHLIPMSKLEAQVPVARPDMIRFHITRRWHGWAAFTSWWTNAKRLAEPFFLQKTMEWTSEESLSRPNISAKVAAFS